MSTLQTRAYTPADLLRMRDSNGVELIDGNLVEKPVSALSSFVEARLLMLLGLYCETRKTAYVFSSANGI